MTPEQKIITIAEFEGWKQISSGQWCKDIKEGVTWSLPPYLTSRDAICGAVARLDDRGCRIFSFILLDLIQGYEPTGEFPCEFTMLLSYEETMKMVLATPAQLADALLLTLGHEI